MKLLIVIGICILINYIVDIVLKVLDTIIEKTYLETKVKYLENQLEEMQQNQTSGFSMEEIKMLKKAVKREMARSHPDQGGDAKTFYHYNELYKKLK